MISAMTYRKKFFGSIIALAALLIILPVTSFSAKESKFWTDYYNELYTDYSSAPDEYLITEGVITDTFETDTGLINFFRSSHCIVEITLPDGQTEQIGVMRDESDEVGDTVEIAYMQTDTLEGHDYIKFTRTKYIKLYGIEKTYNLLRAVNLIAIAAVGTFLAITVLRKKDRRTNGEFSNDVL